ncbi:MAG: tetratricopeptide repeat protein [Pseudohongiella sp.]|nr:tetratricopeptide repeat protein [Pseudohongiella sp.]MDO9520066.1 tetratricopeptide repeat protein [Pseudohongiella sp.]MDP2127971.1 tetratricopeptide repeat protein [Pseudohongiella sp.]
MHKTIRVLSLLLTLSMLSACQLFVLSAGFRSDQDMEARILGDQSKTPSIDLLALDQSVIDYLDTHIDPALQNWEIVDRLQQILFSEEFLNIQYDDAANLTASQTFAERRANCLSLVNLYIGMARHLGLSAQYQTIQIRPIWNRKGELLILSEHINALGRLGPSNQYIVDFTPEVRLQQQTAKLISDRQATALYYNNLGVEHLIAGDFDRSLEHFRYALAMDPLLAIAWNNVGSVLGRMGEADLSEYSYLKASALDRNSASAANNLARLYFEQGEFAKSERYRRAVQSYNRRNPYYHYMLGNLAYEEKNFDAALRHFQEAIRREDQEPDFYMALGMTFRELGDEKAFTDLSQMSFAMRELGDQTYRPTQNRVRRVESRSVLRMTGSGISIRVVD